MVPCYHINIKYNNKWSILPYGTTQYDVRIFCKGTTPIILLSYGIVPYAYLTNYRHD